MSPVADIAIIGGGAAGMSLAAEIAANRATVLLEAEPQAGFHATGRSAAVLVPSYGHDLIRELTRRSQPDFEGTLTPRGLLRLARPEGIAAHDALIAGLTSVTSLTPEAAQEFLPALRPERFAAASFEAQVADIDVDAFMQAWARQARRHGARLELGARVEAIAREAGHWALHAGGTVHRARVLVNAAGGWADRIAEMAGVKPLGLTARRRSVAVLPCPEALAARPVPFTVTFPLRWFAKTDGQSLLVSPGDETPVNPHDAWADDMDLAEGLDRFAADTSVEVTRVTRSWAGLRTFTGDGHPALGFDPAAKDFFWLAGQGGSGIQTAPALARIAAAVLRAEPARDNLAAALSPARLR